MQKAYGKKRLEDSFNFEPKVAENIMQRLLCGQAGVTVITGSVLEWARKEGTEIRSVSMHNGRSYSAKQFIAAS